MEPDEWAEVKKAAARHQVQTGDSYSASAYVRDAVREKLERDQAKAGA